MARDSYRQVSSVAPGVPTDATQRVGFVPRAVPLPESAFTQVGRGLERLGEGGTRAASFFGEVAADDAGNQYQERVNQIMHGVPGRMVEGPDGQPMPDTGYMGKRGRAALDARPEVDREMEDTRKTIRGGLLTPQQMTRFDAISRRYKTFADGRIGQHADTQTNAYFDGVFKAKAQLGADRIARNPDSIEEVVAGREEIRAARVKAAQTKGGGPEQIQMAVEQADKEAVVAQASAISTRDPSKALRIVENNKAMLGTAYDELYNRFRARADQQVGIETADGLLGVPGTPPPQGGDTAAVLRHFESYRGKAYWDVNHWRVGYGSDTVTRADGTVERVREGMEITPADAERDLQRRITLSQQDVQSAIGTEAWKGLSPEMQASLASVSYNYGKLPGSVAEAAKTGDPEKISKAILKLSGHNKGVNKDRRASEAANVLGGVTPPGRTQADLINEVLEDPELKDRPQAQAAAITRVNQSYATQQKAEAKRKAEFKMQVDDSLAEAQQTGMTSKPLTEQDFVRHLGPNDGAAQYVQYNENILFAADYKSLQTMSDVEQKQFLDSRVPTPGQPGYARSIQNRERLQKTVDAIQKQRLENPAGVVDNMPVVQEAFRRVDPKNPATFRDVVVARMQAQAELGIPPENRSPISLPEAQKAMLPVQQALPGMKAAALEKTASEFRTLYGNEAPRAFVYALRAIKISGEAAMQAEGVLMNLSEGRPLTQDEQRAFRDQQAIQAQENALKTAPATQPWMSSGFDMNPPPALEPVPQGRRPVPNSQAIRDLRDNPQTEKEFDATYGPGSAKKLMETYPFYFKKGK